MLKAKGLQVVSVQRSELQGLGCKDVFRAAASILHRLHKIERPE